MVVLPQALLPDGCVSPVWPPDQIHQPPQLTPLEAEEQQWHLRKRHIPAARALDRVLLVTGQGS